MTATELTARLRHSMPSPPTNYGFPCLRPWPTGKWKLEKEKSKDLTRKIGVWGMRKGEEGARGEWGKLETRNQNFGEREQKDANIPGAGRTTHGILFVKSRH